MKPKRLSYRQTHLKVLSDWWNKDLVLSEVAKLYTQLESLIREDPIFQTSYEPVTVEDDAPETIKNMAEAAKAAGVGPMAAVAGAFAEHVGEFILEKGATWTVVENGGDIYLSFAEGEKDVGVFAGTSKFSKKLAFTIWT